MVSEDFGDVVFRAMQHYASCPRAKEELQEGNKKKKKRKERCLSISLLVCGVSVVHHPMMSSAGVAASSSESMNRL